MKKLVIGLLFAACLTGCKNSFLDLQDTQSISPANFPKSLDDLDQLVTSVYAVQHERGFLGYYWFGYSNYCLDHTVDMQWKQDESWIDISIGSAQLDDSKIEYEWRDISKGIYFANSTLNAIQQYRAVAPASEKQAIDNKEGEVLFLRGFYLWHLEVLYGQPDLDGMGVPIIESTPGDLQAMSVPRATTGKCYEAMIEDFKQAAALLAGQTNNHRATEWSAKAALAKVYLFDEKPDSAKIYLEDCIAHSGKKLVSFDSYKNMFDGDVNYEYNSESFFETGNVDQPNRPNNNGSTQQNAGTGASQLFAPFYINPTTGERLAMSYSNEFMHDRNLARFGYSGAAPLTQVEQVNGTYELNPAYVQREETLRASVGKDPDAPDPRLYVCALQPFFDSVMVGGQYYKVAQSEFGKWWTVDPATGDDPNTFYGWALRKNQYLTGALVETRNISGANYYFIRLPEIYLMYAEVIQKSNPALALEYINKVKRRAYGYDPDQPSPVDYKSLTDRTKASAGDYLANNPLLYERWAELFGEAKWWETVRRLKLGPQEAAYYGTVASGRKIVWRDEQYAMPIPTIEFQTNNNPGMVQNPGY